jgi:hypothetical protein
LAYIEENHELKKTRKRDSKLERLIKETTLTIEGISDTSKISKTMNKRRRKKDGE